jgi:carboxyl-terminal processing protease
VYITIFKDFFAKLPIFAAIFLIFNLVSYGDDRVEEYKGLKAFEEVLDIVHHQYINKVDNKKLVENGINGMLNSLDPYSTFLNKEEYNDMKSSTKGEFGGIGVELNMDQGFLKVVSSYKGWPAYKAGVKSGDIIITINDEATNGMTLTQAAHKLKGQSGSKVKLKIYRDSDIVKELEIVREVIKLTPIKVLFYNQENVIYAKIGSFNEKISVILKNELQKIFNTHSNVQGLILDLRDNPGGVFEQAVEISRLFLPKNTVVVSLRSKHYNGDITYKADASDITKNIPIVILINNGSASASEIVAGALQDNDRALIMGEKSFCKGLVQNIIPFSNGSAIKITTAKFYTPSGKSIQEDCIIPDIKVANLEHESYDNGSTRNFLSKFVNQNHSIGDIKYDYPLIRAIDLVKGISLYKKTN